MMQSSRCQRGYRCEYPFREHPLLGKLQAKLLHISSIFHRHHRQAQPFQTPSQDTRSRKFGIKRIKGFPAAEAQQRQLVAIFEHIMGHTLQLYHIHDAFTRQAAVEIFGRTFPVVMDPNHRRAILLTMGLASNLFAIRLPALVDEYIVSLDIS